MDKGSSLEADRFRLLVEAVQDYGIFMLDAKGNIVSWNRGAERISGYRVDDVLGQHFSIFYPEEVRASGWPNKELRLALSRGKYEEENWRVRKDGSRFWASVVITPLIDEAGNLTGFGKVTRDLTERRSYEEALRRSEERYRLLIDSAAEHAIYMLDPDGHVLSWSKGAQCIKGYSVDEVLGNHYSMFFRSEDVNEGLPNWQLQRALLHGRTEEEGWRVRKDGSTFWANIVLTPIRAEDGTLVGFAKVTRDMTERARLHELEHSLSRMNEFLAVLGHELRSPLAPMKHAVALLQMEESLSQRSVASRDILERQVNHLHRLLDELLDAGRLTSGKMVVKPREIPFHRVVKQGMEAVWPFIRERKQVVSLDVAEDIWVNADEMRLVQVVHNLVANASKFTPHGGAIGLSATVNSGQLEVSVVDNGLGMDPATMEQLFTMFSQGANNATRAGGLGIGLALARAIIEMHGGAISATSEGQGRGSSFQFSLPRATKVRAANLQVRLIDAGDHSMLHTKKFS